MRIVKKGGVTPCDRRLDRRKVAIAAAAAVLLFATPVHATTFAISPALSSITLKLSYIDSIDTLGFPIIFDDIDPTKAPWTSFPALTATHPVISNKTSASGTIDAVITPGVKIDFLPTTSIGYALNGGVYFGVAPLSSPPFGTPVPGQIGWTGYFGAVGGSAAALGVVLGLAQTFLPGASAAFSGGTSYGFGPSMSNMIAATAGTASLNILSGGGSLSATSLSTGLAGGPLITPLWDLPDIGAGGIPVDATTTLYGPSSPVAMPATWDGTTLTIPLSSYLDITTVTTKTVTYIIEVSGSLVATVVPEPSTMLLFGFGVAGLLSYAWRKRRGLAA